MKELSMLLQTFKRLVLEEDGMEMIEWAIVGVVFAVAAAVVWTALAGQVGAAVGNIGATVSP
jgi:Flp pilus assembly pilin Flp